MSGSGHPKSWGKVRPVAFSADPAFIEQVKAQIGRRSLSSFVVEALHEKLGRLRSEEGVIRIEQRVGTLLQPLEFAGTWIVAPEEALQADPECASSDGEPTSEEFADGGQDVHPTWWAAAVTEGGSFLWFSSSSPDGIEMGEFQLQVQERADLRFSLYFGVPETIYEHVRRMAPPLPTKRIG